MTVNKESRVECKGCSNLLPEHQVSRMLGNPDYQPWCREGYCSLRCYQREHGHPENAVVRGEGTETEQVQDYGSAPVTVSPARNPFPKKVIVGFAVGLLVIIGTIAFGDMMAEFIRSQTAVNLVSKQRELNTLTLLMGIGYAIGLIILIFPTVGLVRYLLYLSRFRSNRPHPEHRGGMEDPAA